MNYLPPILLLLCLCTTSFGQAIWNGREYYAPVCSKPNCTMCNSINAQLAAQARARQAQAQTPTYYEGNVQTQQVYQTVARQVKRCNGRQCWYETVYEQVLVNVPVQPTPVYVAPKFEKVLDLEPTPNAAVQILFKILCLKPTDIFIEPGCGDGRVLKEASKHCFSIGVELNPETAKLARDNLLDSSAIVIDGNALEFNYSKATVVYMYLYPDLMVKLIPLLPTGTRVVSYCHTAPGIEWQELSIDGHTFYTGIK